MSVLQPGDMARANLLANEGEPSRLPQPVTRRPTIAYVMSRFPQLTETFVLNEMVAIEREGAKVEVYPLRRQRWAKMHAEALEWIERSHFEPLVSWRVAWANLHFLVRRPIRYWATFLQLLWHTWGSARYFVGGLVFFPKAVYLARRMADEGVDHVHAHFASHPAAVAWVIHRLSGIPYSFTAHGSDLHRDRHMLRKKVADAVFVIAISNYNREIIVGECGSTAGAKVAVIHCGVDLEVFRPVPADLAGQGREQSPVVLCVGKLHKVKGQTYLIEACRLLAARGVQFACHLVGDGPDRQELTHHAATAAIGDRVKFHGWLTQEEVCEVLGEADIVVAPSVPTPDGRREGIPLALMEAMARGLPVIASRLSGVPELVEDGKTGFLVEPRDVGGLADVLERLLRDEELRRRLGSAGRSKIEREFNLSRSSETLMRRFLGKGER